MRTQTGSRGYTAALTIILFLFFLLACAPGAYLKWNQVDAAALAAGPAGGEKLNAIRVATFGPHAEQIHGYFLYRDGVEVVTGGGASIERIGKLSLREVGADYAKVVSLRMSDPRVLVTREILRGGAVVGYTVTDIKLDMDLWDITPAGRASTVVLRLEYRDRRNLDSGGDGRGILDSSD
ncbi:MAG: hypothetical protein HPY67_00385 [Syntrophaceae bacterium]|nr:hypothetical protein [Syntrophaceae bacterium]